MPETYIVRLRRISLEIFCIDREMPVIQDPDNFDPETQNEYNSFRIGFVAGCQFQLSECKAVLGAVHKPSRDELILSYHASLPDGP